jgi:hypothetical protein
MARPSKLTPAQWSEVERRLLAGETARSLGREFGINEAAIRKRFGAYQSLSTQSTQVRTAAEKIAEANIALEALPPAQRPIAIDLADKLRSISFSLASAAELGAKTAHRLHALANSEIGKVDDADPLAEESLSALKGVSVLTKLANDSSAIALNLLSANKDAVRQMSEPDQLDQPLTPEREREAMRRIAYLLHKAAPKEPMAQQR